MEIQTTSDMRRGISGVGVTIATTADITRIFHPVQVWRNVMNGKSQCNQLRRSALALGHEAGLRNAYETWTDASDCF